MQRIRENHCWRKAPGRSGAEKRGYKPPRDTGRPTEPATAQSALALGTILWATHGSEHEGIKLLLEAAATGEAEALYLLGLACFRGQGVERDLAAARELHLAAARRGLPDAQFELSLLLAQGLGGDIEAKDARRWEAKAAKAGHPRACLNRGARLANSKRPDWIKVAYWYSLAAAGGHAEAVSRLAAMTNRPEALTAIIRHRDARPTATSFDNADNHNRQTVSGESKSRTNGFLFQFGGAAMPARSVAADEEGAAVSLAPPSEQVLLPNAQVNQQCDSQEGKPGGARIRKANDRRFSTLLSARPRHAI